MKGQMKILADIFVVLMAIALFVAAYFLFTGAYLDIQVTVSEAERERSAINIAQILLSSDKLAYSDDFHIYRGILDETKLNNLQSDSSSLFEEINPKNRVYSIKIENLDSKQSWSIGPSHDVEIMKTFPVTIKHGNEIQAGRMTFYLGRTLLPQEDYIPIGI